MPYCLSGAIMTASMSATVAMGLPYISLNSVDSFASVSACRRRTVKS